VAASRRCRPASGPRCAVEACRPAPAAGGFPALARSAAVLATGSSHALQDDRSASGIPPSAPGPAGYVVVSDMGDRLALLDIGMDPAGDPDRAGCAMLQALALRHKSKSSRSAMLPLTTG